VKDWFIRRASSPCHVKGAEWMCSMRQRIVRGGGGAAARTSVPLREAAVHAATRWLGASMHAGWLKGGGRLRDYKAWAVPRC
jgi:hypothetical protein